MSVFWQHVGDQNSVRDFPRTIGTARLGLREFGLQDIEEHLSEISSIHDSECKRAFDRIGSSRFQIWGFPTGASKTLSKSQVGDVVLLLNTNADWGSFKYVGRILYLLPEEHWGLSLHLWKERKFPIIALLRGQLISYPWKDFLRDFHYGAGLKPMGRTYRVGEAAMANSRFSDENALIEVLKERYPATDEFIP